MGRNGAPGVCLVMSQDSQALADVAGSFTCSPGAAVERLWDPGGPVRA